MPKTQGVLNSVKFDTQTSDFRAVFTYHGKAGGKTVAYVNGDYWYIWEGLNTILIVNEDTERKVIDPASVGAKLENNYYSFDVSMNKEIKAGDKITFEAHAEFPPEIWVKSPLQTNTFRIL